MITVNDASADCKSGWREYKKNCYKVFRDEKNPDQAEIFCNGFNGNLASIMSRDENKFIEKLIDRRSRYSEYLVGLRKRERSIWYWTDNEQKSPIKFLNWSGGNKKRHYGSYGFITSLDGKWDSRT